MTPAQEAAQNLVALRENLDEAAERIAFTNTKLATAETLKAEETWALARERAQDDHKAQLDVLFAALAAPCLKCAEGEE